jgi:hypothetical protein
VRPWVKICNLNARRSVRVGCVLFSGIKSLRAEPKMQSGDLRTVRAFSTSYDQSAVDLASYMGEESGREQAWEDTIGNTIAHS